DAGSAATASSLPHSDSPVAAADTTPCRSPRAGFDDIESITRRTSAASSGPVAPSAAPTPPAGVSGDSTPRTSGASATMTFSRLYAMPATTIMTTTTAKTTTADNHPTMRLTTLLTPGTTTMDPL